MSSLAVRQAFSSLTTRYLSRVEFVRQAFEPDIRA